jgi:fibronectin type 3 domain-containing protein
LPHPSPFRLLETHNNRVKKRDLSLKVYNICNEAITQKKHLKKLESLDQYEYALIYFQDNINIIVANKAKLSITKTLEYIIKMIFHELI